MTRLGRSLATTQIVFSMMLLVFAGLFAQSLANLGRADLGMNIDSVVTFSIAPRRNGYDDTRAMQLFDRVERELAAQPGVTNVASAMVPLISFTTWGGVVKIDGVDPGPTPQRANTNYVSTEFFRTLSIPLRTGRTFTGADKIDSPRVAVVNEAFVREFRLEDGAIGKRVSMDNRPGDVEIVGVVGDAKYSEVKGEVPAQLITPLQQNPDLRSLSFYVRAATPPGDLMAAVRRVVAAEDPNLPVSGLTTMDRVVDDNLFVDRLIALLAGAFAALATLLAATGLYGVLAYAVAQRTRELGLRLALGATVGGLRTMVLRQVATMALIGMPIGLALGVGLGQGAQSLLFGLSGHDPVVLGGAVAVLGAVVLAAGYLPARRASAIAPMDALRYE
jgi:predicted permease